MARNTWWVEMGYPNFEQGVDGFPRPGQVCAYYRQHTIKADGKPWTQKDLAKALGISEQSVIKMEKKDVGLDSLTRRQFLIDTFSIPYILMRMAPKPVSPVEQALLAPAVQQAVHSTIHTVDLTALRADWQRYWTNNGRGTAWASLPEIAAKVGLLYEVLPCSSQTYSVRELLCLYHILIAHILRDQQAFSEAIAHLNRAVRLAKEIAHDELRVNALSRRGHASFESSDMEKALINYRAAEKLLPKVPHYMGGIVMLFMGHAQVESTQDKQAQRQGLKTMDAAANLIGLSGPIDYPSFQLDIARYHLTKGEALIGMGWNKDAVTELSSAQRNPKLLRRTAYSDILEAQALANQGKFDRAASLLESAIVVVKDIQSAVNAARIGKLYTQLKASTFGNNPEVARLTYLLQSR
ncbi:MAG: hypothetical protein JO202_04715 [Ktedonobacteraceae bacterium]|nr:hypothetical protein [Ktedonobacteraceae bacterium]